MHTMYCFNAVILLAYFNFVGVLGVEQWFLQSLYFVGVLGVEQWFLQSLYFLGACSRCGTMVSLHHFISLLFLLHNNSFIPISSLLLPLFAFTTVLSLPLIAFYFCSFYFLCRVCFCWFVGDIISVEVVK